MVLHFCIALVASACTVANDDCPDCEVVPDLAAAVTCRAVLVPCGDAGATLTGEACLYDSDATRGYVRADGHVVACEDGAAQCAAALARLRVDACFTYVEPCRTSPCANGGVCTSGATGFACRCAQGFTGTRCETDVNECLTNPCAPAESCFNTLGSYVCRCPAGFEGAGCTTDVNECLDTPCMNNGSCTNAVGTYSCACAWGFAGDRCEIDRRTCTGTPASCGSRGTASTCAPTLGCLLTAGCGGSISSCSSYYSSYTCSSHPGCYWSSYYYDCTGTQSCAIYGTSQSSCESHYPCYWGFTTCTGTPTPCESMPVATCTAQSGCVLGVLP